MDYSAFLRLLAAHGKESRTFDRKEMCHALQSRNADGTRRDPTGANGELAKDICAMANNGDRSYLVIGISNDGMRWTSVTNPNLTDENVQTFCKEAITPPVTLTVHREQWPEATGDHAGKTCVIIEIGPHPRDHVFRLQRDYIVWGDRICYRRNEVWVRRGETSDLASPEEIVERMGRDGRPQLRVTLAADGQDDQTVTLVRRAVVVPTADVVERVVARAARRLSTTGPMGVPQQDIDAYRDQYRAYLSRRVAYEREQGRFYEVQPALHNTGTHPADDVTLTIQFADMVLATEDEVVLRMNDRISTPQPQPPALPTPSLWRTTVLGTLGALGTLGRQPDLSSFVPPPRTYRPKNRGPFVEEATCAETACRAVTYEADSIQHDDAVRFKPFLMKLPEEWTGDRLDATYTIKARQQRETRRGTVSILFSEGEPLTLESLIDSELSSRFRQPDS